MSKYPEIDAVIAGESEGCIVCGDCREVMSQMPAGQIHLVVTSPPHNLGIAYSAHDDSGRYEDYLSQMQETWQGTHRILLRGGRLAINVGENNREATTRPTYSEFLQQCLDLGYLYRATVIWQKNSASNSCAWGSWLSPRNPHVVPRHEYILLFSKDGYTLDVDGADITKRQFMQASNGTWTFAPETQNRHGHPCPFPVELPTRVIRFLTAPGCIVLDPFCGSGTTCVAAKQLGRRYIGIEIDEHYCKIARERIANTTPPLFAM